jgi:hypothetical protein
MNQISINMKEALDDVSASSAGGAPFLIAYGLTFLITAILSFFLPTATVAIIAMFQGGVALPLAFWLERKMRTRPRMADNPLTQLSGQIAFSQSLGLPAMIVAYSLNPGAIPVVLASLGGVHFLPYAWLHRTRVYMYLGLALAFGAFGLQLILGTNAFSYILLFQAVAYGISAPLVYRNAMELAR